MNRVESTLLRSLAVTMVCCSSLVSLNFAVAQEPMQKHMHHHIVMRPGAIGREQAATKPQLRNHFQTVELIAPEKTTVSVISNGAFQPYSDPVTVGMRIGNVYRLKITNIPERAGFELFPTVEVINRLYTPRGKEAKFSVPVHFTTDDMHTALAGGYVTRVVYLENPRDALPAQQLKRFPQTHNVTGKEDPLHVADQIGRPMAIIRMGSRIPELAMQNGGYGVESNAPPIMIFGTMGNKSSDSGQRSISDQASFKQASYQEGVPASNGVLNAPLIPSMPPGTIDPDGHAAAIHFPPVASEVPVISGEMPVHPNARRKSQLYPIYPREVTNNRVSSEEYLYDGGDRNQQVDIGEDFSIKGLDTEDTVAHFDTLDGKRLIQPSNRVRIYSPRFGSVRRVSGVLLSRSSTHLAGTGEKVLTSGQQHTAKVTTKLQRTQLDTNINAHGANSLGDLARVKYARSQVIVAGFHNKYSTFENYRLIRFGLAEQTEKARLAQSIQKATAWTDNLGAQVFVNEQLTATTNSRTKLQDVTGVDMRQPKIKMRVVKVASKGDAKPGTIVEFTIRFDNLSNEEVGNVTIMDNLTQRLEFIPGSEQCSLKSEFIPTSNKADSVLLRWEITDPMKPNTGGIVRFKCLVR